MKKFYPKLYKEQLRVGLFTIIILAIAIVGYLWLSSRITAHAQHDVVISFSDVVGLEVGDKAMFRGMEIGRVKKIVARSSDILVTASINRDIVLREGARFFMAANSLMGGATLNMAQGTGPGTLDLRRVQTGETPVGFAGMMAKAGVTIDELNGILQELRSEQGMIAKSATLLDNADLAVRSVDGLAMSANAEITVTLQRIQEMTNQVKQLVNDNSEQVASMLGSAPVTMQNINSTLDSLQILSNQLGDAMNHLNSGKGTAGKLLRDDMLYTKLENSVASLDSLIRDVKANPKRYVRFSLF